MKNTVRMSISTLALMLAAPVFASVSIPDDNIAWSARPAQTVVSSSACSAYSGRPMSSGESLSAGTALKAIGTSLAGTALGLVTGGYQGAAPNPCARPGL